MIEIAKVRKNGEIKAIKYKNKSKIKRQGKKEACQVITIKINELLNVLCKGQCFGIHKIIQKIGLLLFTKIMFTITDQGSDRGQEKEATATNMRSISMQYKGGLNRVY